MSKSAKTSFVIVLCAIATLAAAEPDRTPKKEEEPVTQSTGYVQLGLGPAPLPLPVFGVGYRAQKGHNGVDTSLQVTTVVFITEVKARGLYHYYFTPNLKSQFYAGAGLGISTLIYEKHSHSWRVQEYISPEFVFGKQYQNNIGSTRFFQAQLSFPSFHLTHFHRPFYYPLLVLSYGIAF